MTYAVGDTQYVAVLSGPPALYSDVASRTGPNRVLAFALGGKANLPPPPAPPDPISAPNVQIPATTTELAEGGALFSAYCSRCHNFTSNLVKGDAVPDLRRTTAAVHATFDSIVIRGARRTLGMPSFAKDLGAAQVRLIHAYLVDEAQRASKPTLGSASR